MQTLWHFPRFGDSNSVLGIYQIVRVLQLLIDWSVTSYRPWFEKYALGSTPGGRNDPLKETAGFDLMNTT